MQSFVDSWNEEVPNLVKLLGLSFHDSHSSEILDQPRTLTAANDVVKTIKSNKSTESDSIIGELIKYRGKPMCEMLMLTLFNLV